MAFNPFKSKPPVDKPSRNAFDLSFANNLTMEFGKLYPVFCKECLPGDTFKIDPTFAFKFMPMYFPVQSRMRADLKFFYVRNRNLWVNWKKFIGQTDRITGQEVIPPYLDIIPAQAERLQTRSLLDYLGVPTTAPVLTPSSLIGTMDGYNGAYADTFAQGYSYNNGEVYKPFIHRDGTIRNDPKFLSDYVNDDASRFPNGSDYAMCVADFEFTSMITADSEFRLYLPDIKNALGESVVDNQIDTDKLDRCILYIFREGDYSRDLRNTYSDNYTNTRNSKVLAYNTFCEMTYDDTNKMLVVSNIDKDGFVVDSENTKTLIEFLSSQDDLQGLRLAFSIPYKIDGFFQPVKVDDKGEEVLGQMEVFPYKIEITDTDVIVDRDISIEQNPFIHQDGDSGPVLPLSALPSRAYEAIFNGFYRNVEVDPFRINGQIEYDKFIPNDGDGADNYPYNFHYQYWEHDFLTDSVPSPQQGIAPLVGGRPAQTLVYDIKNDVGDNYRVYATNDRVGTLLGLAGYSNDLIEGQQYAPESTIQALQEAITFGISINDFRNVNALQKWLEKNIRRGYRYKDQMMSHFGVSLSYEECDMPEYLGGVSEDVNVRAISSTVETENAPLGSYAGQATCMGSSKHTINKYTDEHGFIMGILCVTPIPTYSQLLPKHFTKFSPFDFFSPEFGHIGLQPIPMKEVAPLNVSLEQGNQEETFGYQRAFYDYLQSTDEVHGEFRASLQNYLVDRVFQGVPRLSKEFLEVDPTQVNDVFNYTGGDDKILGQIWFDCEVVRPIPKYGVPKIAD